MHSFTPRSRSSEKSEPPAGVHDGSSRGWGIEIGNIKAGSNTRVHDNIFAQDTENTSAAILLEYGSNLDNPGDDCDLDYVPHEARRRKVDYALSNSFGFGGQNTALILRRFAG